MPHTAANEAVILRLFCEANAQSKQSKNRNRVLFDEEYLRYRDCLWMDVFFLYLAFLDFKGLFSPSIMWSIDSTKVLQLYSYILSVLLSCVCYI